MTKRGRYRTSETPGQKREKLVQLDTSTDTILRSMSAATGISQNALVNAAIVAYAATTPTTTTAAVVFDTYAASLPEVRDQWAEAVSRLAGEPEEE